MEFSEVLKKRKMIRKFQRKPVPDELIMKLLATAQRAPSAGFTQVQEFVIIKDEKTKNALAKAAFGQEQVSEAPVVIVVCSNWGRAHERYGERAKNFYSITDGAFSSLLILLSCIEHGLGACFVGAFHDEEVAKILKLPDKVRPIGIIAIGYPDEKPGKFHRFDLKKILHFEKW